MNGRARWITSVGVAMTLFIATGCGLKDWAPGGKSRPWYCTRNGGPFIVGDNISDQQCAALGGTNQDTSDIWLLHVWLPIYDGWQATDIFNKTHPTV